ncbi:4-hydroxybenzoate octaprenyltransferase [Basilea psittacipulmonis]|uniref:4-hydroxybenzoate octaprenyltransferase n=1 Tax=Basilea psittacipulmonis DSM 24701 TaxID=1072685 RepID=A0A077DEU7_9BURK|nr:4-hydroxybenzoate octaprenyltransferase [Basilea psittacipulmonis]AIL33360.1 4-hydroxybenzoate polyprenyltransferase [Basilea psittacipulmonis DSM 24701]
MNPEKTDNKPISHHDLNDIRLNDWVSKYLPVSWQPYARLCRLDRPVGTWLTLLPCIAALIQAAHGLPDIGRLIVFSLGALLMRSVGCTINDIWDRDFDKHVERTRYRPLTNGDLSLKQAVMFLLAQLVLTACLLFFLNTYTIYLAIAVVPLTIIYPLCKRFTYWPQVVLSLAFNWGMLMAWTDTLNTLPWGAVLMWLGAVTWQIAYDTMYAYADLSDDEKLGLKSTARLFQQNGLYWLSYFYTLTALLWLVGGILLDMSIGYYVALAIITAFLVWQLYQFDLKNPARNFQLFKINIWTGVLLIVASLLGVLQ